MRCVFCGSDIREGEVIARTNLGPMHMLCFYGFVERIARKKKSGRYVLKCK